MRASTVYAAAALGTSIAAGCTSESINDSSDASSVATDAAPPGALDASTDSASTAKTGADASTQTAFGTQRCEPGTEAPCYEGPGGTNAWGRCKSGTRRCNDDGLDYGACVGQVLPIAERCETPDDDDCNGLVNEP